MSGAHFWKAMRVACLGVVVRGALLGCDAARRAWAAASTVDRLYAAVDAAMNAFVHNKRVWRWTMLVLALFRCRHGVFRNRLPFFGFVWGLAACLQMGDLTWKTERGGNR